MPAIFFTVTNDLSYDQRMIRICSSLAQAGYDVTLVGRKMRHSISLTQKPYKQKRLNCFFEKGKLFYAEYNLRLFFFLLSKKMDAICAIDLDTIIPCYLVSRVKGIKRIYDAHEYFSQQKEIISRPSIYKIWHGIEKKYVPKFASGYTVSHSIATEFKKIYGVSYDLIRNMPVHRERNLPAGKRKKIVLYQGAVNEARGLEFLIPAMKDVDAELHIYGNGNFVEEVRTIVSTNNLADKVFMKGMLSPEALADVTLEACIGINLVENKGLNQYYSLANKFFDYIQDGLPQVTMNFPEYKKINNEFEVALLIDDLEIKTIGSAINRLLNDDILYSRLQLNCLQAAKVLNWQNEEKKLLAFYKNIFG